VSMTDDEAALLRAVCATPAADLPRLVYADWLDDRGRPEWAEYIRLAVAVPEPVVMTAYTRISHRNRVLYDANAIPILSADPGHAGVVVCRGFVETIDLPLAAYTRYAAGLFARHPITRATLTDREPYRDGGGRWLWYNGERAGHSGTHPASDLPREVFDALAGDDPSTGEDGYRKGYWKREAAVAAVSTALVRIGRHRAGLPPL
jgi:uncharacterized protein (TIGR02996 family)